MISIIGQLLLSDSFFNFSSCCPSPYSLPSGPVLKPYGGGNSPSFMCGTGGRLDGLTVTKGSLYFLYTQIYKKIVPSLKFWTSWGSEENQKLTVGRIFKNRSNSRFFEKNVKEFPLPEPRSNLKGILLEFLFKVR